MTRRPGSAAVAWSIAALSLFYAVLCVAVPWVWWDRQLAAPPAYDDITFFSYDQYYYTVPTFRYAAEYLRRWQLPLWTPQQLSGSPFLAAQLHGLLYPLHWVIAWLPLAEVWRLLIFVHAIVAMSGAYYCARVFGASRPAAVMGGATYAFAAPMTAVFIASMDPAVVSAAWLPWQLAFTRRTLVAPHRWVAPACGLGIVTALTVLGGHLPCLPIAVFVCTAYILCHLAWLWWRRGGVPMLRRSSRLAVGAIVAVGLSAVQLFPTAELSLRSQRVGSYTTATDASFGAEGRQPSVILSSLFDPLQQLFGFADELFLGTATALLAVLALLDRSLRRRAMALWLLATVTLLISLGTTTPVFGWYFHLQGGAFRAPQRFVMATALCLAVLSALGAEAFRRTARARRAFVILCGSGALVLWVLVRAGQQHDWLLAYIRSEGFVQSYRVLLGLALAAVPLAALPATLVRRWLAPAGILALAAFSAHQLHGAFAVLLPIPATRPDALPVPVAAARFLRAQAGFARVATPIRPSWRQVPVRLGLLENLFAISDYEPLVDRRYAELLWPMSGVWGRPDNAHLGPFLSEVTPATALALRILGVGYVLVTQERGPKVSLAPPVYADEKYAVYALDHPLPRVYVAVGVEHAATPAGALDVMLRQPEWILRGGAVVEQPGDLTGSFGTARISRYEDQLVEVEATLNSPGLVVLGDTFDPFWVVTVDGVRQEILRTNYAFRGVRVGAGQHTLRFEYYPWLISLGAGVSAVTIVGLAVTAAAALWRRRLCRKSRERRVVRGAPPGAQAPGSVE